MEKFIEYIQSGFKSPLSFFSLAGMYLNTLCLCRQKLSTNSRYHTVIFIPLVMAIFSPMQQNIHLPSNLVVQGARWAFLMQTSFQRICTVEFPEMHLKICPLSKVSDTAMILQDRQDRKKMVEEQEICPKITQFSGRTEIIIQVFCNQLQYR